MSLELKITNVFNVTDVKGRKEDQNDDRVTAVDIDFKGSISDAMADQFCANEEYFSDSLWRDNDDKSIRHPQLGTLAITTKYDGHQIKLFSPILENSDAILILNQAKITKIKMKPQDGGQADVTFQIHGVVAHNEDIGKLFNELLECDVKAVIQPQQTDFINDENEKLAADG